MNKQKLTLAILLTIFGAAVIYSFITFPRQQKVADLKYKNGDKASSARVVTKKSLKQPNKKSDVNGVDDTFLHLEALSNENIKFSGYKRNIFKPIFVDEIKNMKEKAALLKPPVFNKPVTPPKQIKPDEPAKPEPPKSALAKFTFLGFLEKDGIKTLFLTKDKEILLVKQGERFGGAKYEVTAIKDTVLTILVSETGEEIVIPLSENKPLLARK